MILRLATPDDARSIAKLHAASWRTAYRGMYSDEYLDGPADKDRRKVWKKRFAAPADNQYVLLALEGDKLLGFVCAFGDQHERWGTLVDNLHVRLDQQGQGLGRRLLAASALWSRTNYPDALFHLFVLDGNAKARRFYGHLGGEPVESRTIEPPGGGSILSWRYAWQGASFGALAESAAG